MCTLSSKDGFSLLYIKYDIVKRIKRLRIYKGQEKILETADSEMKIL